MESFTIFNSSAMVDQIIFYYFSQQRFGKLLGMTCNCIRRRETEFRIKKQKQDPNSTTFQDD